MRRSLAIDVECFADDELDRIQRRSQGSLRDEWSVTKDNEPTVATVFARPGRPGSPREHVNLSGRGKFGRYLKRAGRFPGYLGAITSDDAQQIIADLLRALASCRPGQRGGGPAPPPRDGVPGPGDRAGVACR